MPFIPKPDLGIIIEIGVLHVTPVGHAGQVIMTAGGGEPLLVLAGLGHRTLQTSEFFLFAHPYLEPLIVLAVSLVPMPAEVHR